MNQLDPEVLEGLRQQADALALQLVMEDTPGDSFRRSLELLSQDAARHGRTDAAEVAAGLAAATEDAKSLQQGIERLQRMLEPGNEEVAPAPATPQSAASSASSVFNSVAHDPELLGDFVVEAREHLASIETRLLELEQDPGGDAIHAVFRSFHTIKGLAGFLELNDVREVAHETETALDLARNGQLAITPEVIDRVLAAADFVKHWVGRIETMLGGGTVGPEPPYAALVEAVRLLSQAGAAPQPAAPAPPIEIEFPEVEPLFEETPAALAPPPEAPATADAKSLDAPAKSPEPPAKAQAAPDAADPSADAANRSAKESSAGLRSVKVDTAKLDFLVDMVGELVIAQAMVRHDPALGKVSQKLQRNLSQLTRITADVQKTAMAMRMVPIGQLFQRTARLVRDLARKSGKKIELVTEGAETELDRTIVEEVADPLMHMVRNSIDHGVETPQDRVKAGKPESGTIRLKAWHQAGHIAIEVSDDGRGLDRDRILTKARQRGLVGQSDNPPDSEVWSLIFEPGFSTAEKVTDISGRGVGMDVVRKHIQKLRGRIETRSTKGKGTDFVMKLPLTLAIIDGLVVKTGEERYIVPLFVVSEMLRPSAEMLSTVQGKQEMALVRNRLLPVIRLYRRFGVTPRSEEATESLLVVTEAGGRPFCLMVDELIGKQEVVIKSLGETMKNVRGIAGGAILGDGRVGLILDVDGIFAADQASGVA